MKEDKNITVLEDANTNTTIDRIKPFTLDDYYIESFLDYPLNKTDAYIRAVDAMGTNVDQKYARQYAHAIHTRLQIQIDAALQLRVQDDSAYGRHVIRELAESSKSEQVRAQCAKTLASRLYEIKEQAQAGLTINVNRDSTTIIKDDQSITIEHDVSD